ncbi:hypothetical protein D3C71_1730060 [compost metagenome]
MALLWKPADDQSHRTDPDRRIEESDHRPVHQELRKAGTERLRPHEDSGTKKADRERRAPIDTPDERRPDQHAHAVRQSEDALSQSGLAGSQGQICRDE